jgi:hypothetical protein
MAAPGIESGGGEIVITFEDLHARRQPMGPPERLRRANMERQRLVCDQRIFFVCLPQGSVRAVERLRQGYNHRKRALV